MGVERQREQLARRWTRVRISGLVPDVAQVLKLVAAESRGNSAAPAGKDRRQKEMRAAEDEKVGRHRQFKGHERANSERR